MNCCHSELKSSNVPYGVIIDESMQIGGEKHLLSLGVKVHKGNVSALKIRILDKVKSREIMHPVD